MAERSGSRRDDLPGDHYAVLGLARAAGHAEVRRAFRVLALRHHPDRAGPESTELFQRLSAAYAILSDPHARARYDDHLDAHRSRRTPVAVRPDHRRETHGHPPAGTAGTAEAGHFAGPGGHVSWRRHGRAASGPASDSLPPITRLSGALEALLHAGAARRLAGGVIELGVSADEATRGGVALVDAAVPVTCPTCLGLAERDVLWCRRCEHAGAVIDHVTFTIELLPGVKDGTRFTFVTDPRRHDSPFRVRIRLADLP